MRSLWPVLSALVLALMPLSAKADEALSLEPSSGWAMNYADDSCRLIRIFGEGEDEVRLELRQFVHGRTIWALVSGTPVGVAKRGVEEVSYRFAPDSGDIATITLRGELDDGSRSAMFRASLEPFVTQRASKEPRKRELETWTLRQLEIDAEREAQIVAFEIDLSSTPRLVLKLGSMGAPMRAVRTCLDDLLMQWGVDPALQGTDGKGVPPVPTGSPGNWLRPSDYPTRMLRERRNEQVDFRLMVDTTGKPTECAVLTMEARSEFIDATCETLMRRARFAPARDAEGQAVPGVYVNSVRWFIP
jgi:hypothetical protein